MPAPAKLWIVMLALVLNALLLVGFVPLLANHADESSRIGLFLGLVLISFAIGLGLGRFVFQNHPAEDESLSKPQTPEWDEFEVADREVLLDPPRVSEFENDLHHRGLFK